MKIEIWKDILGYEGLYQVSNLGRVKSLEKIVREYNGFTWKNSELIMSPGKVKNGYLQLRLTKNGKRKAFYVHVLVAVNFNLPKGELDTEVNHINGIVSDNRLENLEWVTRRENQCHRWSLKNTSSKYAGVCYHKSAKKWESYIQHNKKKFYLGLFDTQEEAHNERIKFELNNNIINKYNGKI